MFWSKQGSKCYCLIAITVLFAEPVCMQFSQCVNPQSVKGQCVPIQSCEYVLNIAKYNQGNPEAQVFLRQSQCGFNGFQTFVCCPQTTLLRPAQNQNQQQSKNVLSEKLSQSVLLKPPTCGSDIEDRIFGGTKTSIYEFPWFALLKYSRPGSSTPVFSCSGTLISDRHTITAAHCLHPQIIQRTRLIGVRLGEWNVLTDPDCDDSLVNEQACNNPHIDVAIEAIIIHEKYLPQSFNQHNDIALIKMSQKVAFNEFIKPICLQVEKTGSLAGQSVTVAGFGKTETALSSSVKLKASLNIVENDKCNQVFRTEGRRLHEMQICAGGKKNVDSCRGDSGGPVMKFITKDRTAYWILVGIVSYGSSPCGQENRPAVYTRVDSYINWIENKMRL